MKIEDAPGIEKQPERWPDLYGDFLFRQAMVRLNDRASARDAVQDALLAALRGVRDGKFDGRVDFRHWLRAILRNKVIDIIRQRVRERPVDTSDTDGLGESLLYRLTGLPRVRPDDWAFDLDLAFERQEFWAAFEGCLAHLGESQRTAFTLKVIDELSTEEVCKILGVTANHLGVLLHRARAALKPCLESKWFIQDPEKD